MDAAGMRGLALALADDVEVEEGTMPSERSVLGG